MKLFEKGIAQAGCVKYCLHMRTTYTSGQFRRNERKLARNAQCVTDNRGGVYRITRQRRILEVFSNVLGRWELPRHTDGIRIGLGVYVPKSTNLIPWKNPVAA